MAGLISAPGSDGLGEMQIPPVSVKISKQSFERDVSDSRFVRKEH